MSETTFALIIAIENYQIPEHFPKIRYATKDAYEFYNAMKGVGVQEDNMTVLIDVIATKTRIIKELQAILGRITEYDRVIFYFTGHGAFEHGENYILPVDCYHDDIVETGVSINKILGLLKKSFSQKNILFLDCCHSGFEPGDDTKAVDKRFLTDNLIYETREEKYTVGFASSKSNQTSITHPDLNSSVWTHFLIQALTGSAEKVYENGLLFSDKLQSYLNKSTKEYVKLHTLDKKDQTPVMFGNNTDRFIIADLNPIFDEIAKRKKVTKISLKHVDLYGSRNGYVDQLPGFQKKMHQVPSFSSSSTKRFVKTVGHELIAKEVSEIGEKLRSLLKYKLKQLQANIDNSSGSITTPDFSYSIELSQSAEYPGQYTIERRIDDISNPELMLNNEFNNIFDAHFESLLLYLSSDLDIEKFIADIEESDLHTEVELDYDPSNLSYCGVTLMGNKFRLTKDMIIIEENYLTSPKILINSYINLTKVLPDYPKLKLLTINI